MAQLIAEGSVRLGQRRAERPLQPLTPGERVTVFIAAAPPRPVSAPELRIAMQDAEVMVIEKPPGLSTQPGRRGGPSLTALLPPQVSLLHRLDAEASGLLLAARTPQAAAALQQALDAGAISRSYVAVVAGSPPDSGCIELRIGPRAQSGPMSALRQCYPRGSAHGQPATTLFQVIARSGAGAAAQALLLVRIRSGRTHQIRVHLAALGSPIYGDPSYGGPAAARLLLHAAELRFLHPRTGKPCHVLSLPDFAAAGLSFVKEPLASAQALASAFAEAAALNAPQAGLGTTNTPGPESAHRDSP